MVAHASGRCLMAAASWLYRLLRAAPAAAGAAGALAVHQRGAVQPHWLCAPALRTASSLLYERHTPPHSLHMTPPCCPPQMPQSGWASAVLAGLIMAAASSWLLLLSLPQQLRAGEQRREQLGALAKEIQL